MAEAPRSHWFAVRNPVPGDKSVAVKRRLIWKPGETTGSWRRFSNKRKASKMRSMEAASWKTTNARRSVKRGSGKTGARLKHREQSKPAPTAAARTWGSSLTRSTETREALPGRGARKGQRRAGCRERCRGCRAGGTERKADGDFVLVAGGAGDEQTGDIGRGDEEDTGDRGEQDFAPVYSWKWEDAEFGPRLWGSNRDESQVLWESNRRD